MSGTYEVNVSNCIWLHLSSVPGNLVCSISSYHVSHSFITTRVIWHPGPHIQDLAVHNDNGPAIGDMTFNLPTTEDFGLPLRLRSHDCGTVR
jgi:hypothetical protein